TSSLWQLQRVTTKHSAATSSSELTQNAMTSLPPLKSKWTLKWTCHPYELVKLTCFLDLGDVLQCAHGPSWPTGRTLTGGTSMARLMARLGILASVIAAGFGITAPAFAQSTVYIPAVLELSGAGAVSGTNFRDGMLLAIEEINAKGGILGRKINNQLLDT